MTESLWKWRLYLFVRASDNTAQNRQAFGAIFANNTSGESEADEANLFNSVVRLSVSGSEPAQVLGINTAVKQTMRNAMAAFLDTLSQSRYYGVMNIETESNFDGKLIIDNKTAAGQPTLVGQSPWDIQPFKWSDALQDLFDERGLQVIQEII
jgi:hypothetical protein